MEMIYHQSLNTDVNEAMHYFLQAQRSGLVKWYMNAGTDCCTKYIVSFIILHEVIRKPVFEEREKNKNIKVRWRKFV